MFAHVAWNSVWGGGGRGGHCLTVEEGKSKLLDGVQLAGIGYHYSMR
jgi:hypothetical protein